MSDNEVPVQKWWPNYPNPVQMYLCWERGDKYRLVYNESELENYFSLSAKSNEDNSTASKEAEVNGDLLVSRPSPSNSVAVYRKNSAGTSENLPNDEIPTSSKNCESKKSKNQKAPNPTGNSSYSNEKAYQNNDDDSENMRPYKKRSFHSHLQSSDNNMENENSEDSDKQASSSPPIEEVEKDKDKGETKRRKRWKRKISRKQFRHHDIKLFTPGQYKTTSLLKQKDQSATTPKKPELGSKEFITDLIVTTLGGQKQVTTQKKIQMEEAADSTTKNDAEENNNTNGIQNNNTGKHNLPAIIMETPKVRRRSMENANISKTNLKNLDDKFNRRMSADMPVLNLPQKILEHPEVQAHIARQDTSVRNNGLKVGIGESRNDKNISNNTGSDMKTKRYSTKHIPVEEIQNLSYNPQKNRYVTMEQNYSRQNPKYNEQMEYNDRAESLSTSNQEPMETDIDGQSMEPENLSLKRRHSGDIPVDLSKKNVENVDHRQKLQQNADLKRIHGSETINMSPYRSLSYHQTNNITSHTYSGNYTINNASASPKVHQHKPHDQDQAIPHTILADKVAKMTHLNMWQEVLKRLLKQSFTLQILDLMAHAYEQIDRAKDESLIPPELKSKAQKLLSDAFSFISSKLKQLNLDVNPVYVIQILGQSDSTPEKNTLKHYIENIERIRNLAIEETISPAMPQIPTTHFTHPSSSLQNYKQLPRSPPSLYSNSQQHRNSRENHLYSQPFPLTSDYSSPLGHQGRTSRVEGHHMAPGYLRASPQKPGNQGRYSRETSPKTGDHHILTEQFERTGDYSIPQRHSRGPSPQTHHHDQPVRNLYSQEYSGSQPPQTGEHSISFGQPRGPPLRIGNSPRSQGSSREPSPRNVDHPAPPGETFLIGGEQLMQQGHSQRPSPKSNDRYVSLEHINEPSLRTSKQYVAERFTERPPISGNHSTALGCPRDLQVQHPGAYQPNHLNPNPFLSQPTTRSPGSVGRPRSKSHRNTDSKNGHQHNLKRSLSNPQHAAIENPSLTHPYLEQVTSRMPPPRGSTSATQSFHSLLQSNNILPPPLARTNTTLPPPPVVQNKDLPISPSTATSKTTVPLLYSEVFYQNLYNHVAKGNPLAISVHPLPRTYQKKTSKALPNVQSLNTNQSHKAPTTVREVHQKSPEEYHTEKEPPLVTNPTEAKITSSTDHIEISKVTNVTKQPGQENVSLPDPASPKPPEIIKSIPVAVIVADKSMQITKETTARVNEARTKEASMDVEEHTEDHSSVSSNTKDNISSSEENLRQAFDLEQEENNMEFLVWLEKLKNNEKLKSRFLSQMGIIKKEETPFISGNDPIEIVDSDEEDSSERQTGKETIEKSTESNETSASHEVPAITTRSPNTLEVNKVASLSNQSEETRDSSPKESLSKKDYIPPIPLPYVPSSNEQTLGYGPAPIKDKKKAIYSPEIEPISPVGNETSFTFPNVTNGSKLLSPLNINSKDRGFPESVTSPTYNKRKNPLDFPGYQSDESVGTPTDYPNDSSVKRRKSLDRPELTRSPRVAPSGKLCYVRASHMFLRYFDDTQVDLFIRNLSTQDEEILRSTGIEPEQFKSSHQASTFGQDQLAKTEIIYLPRDVEFSQKEDIPEVEEFIKETSLVEQFVPKDFADFYRYVTGFQIIKNKDPVSLQTFLTMYNTNRTSELLRKYLQRDEVVSSKR